RFFRIALFALVPMVSTALPIAYAQSPTPASPAPAATPAPTPAPPPAETKSPGDLPSTAPQATAPPPVQTADPFGEQVTLASKTVIVTKGTASWDSAFDTLIGSLKTLTAALEKEGGKATGNSMIV